MEFFPTIFFKFPFFKRQNPSVVHLTARGRIPAEGSSELVVVVVVVVVVNFSHSLFFSRTTGTISTKLGTKHPFVKGIQINSYERSRLYLRGYKKTLTKLKNILLKNHKTNFNQTWHYASSGKGNSILFK